MNELELTFTSIEKITEKSYEALERSYDNPRQFNYIVRERYDENNAGTFHVFETYQQAKEYLISLL